MSSQSVTTSNEIPEIPPLDSFDNEIIESYQKARQIYHASEIGKNELELRLFLNKAFLNSQMTEQTLKARLPNSLEASYLIKKIHECKIAMSTKSFPQRSLSACDEEKVIEIANRYLKYLQTISKEDIYYNYVQINSIFTECLQSLVDRGFPKKELFQIMTQKGLL